MTKVRSTDSEEYRGKRRRTGIEITLLVAAIIGIGGWIWTAFFQPMVKTPSMQLDEVSAAVKTKVDQKDYDKQCSFTQAQIDKKLDKEQYYAAHNSLKEFIVKQNELVIGQVKSEVRDLKTDVKTVINMHLNDEKNK